MITRSGDGPSMTWSEISARRMARNRILHPDPDETPVTAVGAQCGAHAQVMSAAEVSVCLRTTDATRYDVRAALWESRTLVKTRGPRGTVHLLPSHDLPMWTGALSALPPSQLQRSKDSVLTPEQTEVLVDAVAEILAVTAELTTEELTSALVDKVGSWAGDPVMEGFQQKWPRWTQAGEVLAFRGSLCFGPNRGRKTTFTSPRRWLPGFRAADQEEAVPELLRRYLRAYGPSTPQHFATWLATTRRWATEAFDRIATEIDEVTVAGERGWWVLAGDTDVPADPVSGLRLLPYFDAYVIAARPRDQLIPAAFVDRAGPGGGAGTVPVVLLGDTVGGIWHQRRSGRRLHVTVEPFAPLSAAHRHELDERVERIAEIQDARPELTIGQVTVGPHA